MSTKKAEAEKRRSGGNFGSFCTQEGNKHAAIVIDSAVGTVGKECKTSEVRSTRTGKSLKTGLSPSKFEEENSGNLFIPRPELRRHGLNNSSSPGLSALLLPLLGAGGFWQGEEGGPAPVRRGLRGAGMLHFTSIQKHFDFPELDAFLDVSSLVLVQG